MAVILGSARVDENGKYVGGIGGDQKQKSSVNDTAGEVSMQGFYLHSKGWYILRPIDPNIANKIADNMTYACNNANIGYSQSDRYGVIKYGTHSTVKTNADCSSLVRQCIIEASGQSVPDFNTSSQPSVLEKTGLFENRIAYVNPTETPLYTGDVLVTKTKGHTVVVVAGNDRVENKSSNTTVVVTEKGKCFEQYTGTSTSITSALKSLGIDSSKTNRVKIAEANGITGYTGTAAQNITMLNLLKSGALINPDSNSKTVTKYFSKYTGKSLSIVTALSEIGSASSKDYRSKIAAANGITNYNGNAIQNTSMLNLLKKGLLIMP